MRIVVNGHPALRRPSLRIDSITPEILQLGKDLTRSLLECETPGVGLAAPQIGINLRAIVVKTCDDNGRSRPGALPGELLLDPQMPVVLINPEIISVSAETDTISEGCLSLPGVSGKVTRPVSVVLHAQLLDGSEITAECGGLLARCLQHEIDHLDGTLFYDRISKSEQRAAAAVMEKLAKREAGLAAVSAAGKK